MIKAQGEHFTAHFVQIYDHYRNLLSHFPLSFPFLFIPIYFCQLRNAFFALSVYISSKCATTVLSMESNLVPRGFP